MAWLPWFPVQATMCIIKRRLSFIFATLFRWRSVFRFHFRSGRRHLETTGILSTLFRWRSVFALVLGCLHHHHMVGLSVRVYLVNKQTTTMCSQQSVSACAHWQTMRRPWTLIWATIDWAQRGNGQTWDAHRLAQELAYSQRTQNGRTSEQGLGTCQAAISCKLPVWTMGPSWQF